MRSAPKITFGVTGSLSRKNANRIVITTLSLSMGATREISPNCIALK